MDTVEFTRLVRIGLGRAIVYLRDHDPVDYAAVVLNACLTNWAFDRQVEGSRGWYLRQLIRLSGAETAIRSTLLQAIGTTTGYFDARQLLEDEDVGRARGHLGGNSAADNPASDDDDVGALHRADSARAELERQAEELAQVADGEVGALGTIAGVEASKLAAEAADGPHA